MYPAVFACWYGYAHHILFKKGHGAAQQALVQEGQDILRKYGIDPIVGPEVLVWAPNRVKGQHDVIALEQVLESLRAADESGRGYDAVVEALEELGNIASRR